MVCKNSGYIFPGRNGRKRSFGCEAGPIKTPLLLLCLLRAGLARGAMSAAARIMDMESLVPEDWKDFLKTVVADPEGLAVIEGFKKKCDFAWENVPKPFTHRETSMQGSLKCGNDVDPSFAGVDGAGYCAVFFQMQVPRQAWPRQGVCPKVREECDAAFLSLAQMWKSMVLGAH
jgi:hypothetical protein